MNTYFLSVEDADGADAAVLGLGGLKVSESCSTASIYPGSLLVGLSRCPVAVPTYRDTHVTDIYGL